MLRFRNTTRYGYKLVRTRAPKYWTKGTNFGEKRPAVTRSSPSNFSSVNHPPSARCHTRSSSPRSRQSLAHYASKNTNQKIDAKASAETSTTFSHLHIGLSTRHRLDFGLPFPPVAETCHVDIPEHVDGRPATVQKPVHREQHRDVFRR